jgi:hypothetical protein
MNTASLLRSGLNPGPLLGTLAVLGLLIVFAGVVREAVQHADASRRANALLAEAHWRCKALKLPRQRDDCLRLFHEEQPGDSAALQSLVSAAAARPMAGLGATR